MKKRIVVIACITCLTLTGCRNGKLENIDNADVIINEADNYFANIQNISYGILYPSKDNGLIYELSQEEIKELASINDTIEIEKKTADDIESAFPNDIKMELYQSSDDGYTECFSFYITDDAMYCEIGWNSDGKYDYRKFKSDELSDWLKKIKDNAATIINNDREDGGK